MPRLFTALEIPRDAALSLSLLRGGLPGARWLDVENYHITLRFIGDIDGPTADELISSFDRIDRPSFSLSLSGMGSFGSKKPHSIWAGVSPSAELKALQAEIERICQRRGLAPDPRRFAPHVTLARLRNARVGDVVVQHLRQNVTRVVGVLRIPKLFGSHGVALANDVVIV